jgi:hypothetical protein
MVEAAYRETYVYDTSSLPECLFQQTYFLVFLLLVYHDSLRLHVVIPPLDLNGWARIFSRSYLKDLFFITNHWPLGIFMNKGENKSKKSLSDQKWVRRMCLPINKFPGQGTSRLFVL